MSADHALGSLLAGERPRGVYRLPGPYDGEQIERLALDAGWLFAPVWGTGTKKDMLEAIGEPGNLSALNRLDGVVLAVQERAGSIWVTVDCSGEVVLAQVTRHSAARMALGEGQPVSLLFKSVSIDTQGLFRRQT